MNNLFRKLKRNQAGFSHHLLIPIVVIVAVAGVGTYILRRSHAAELPSGTNSVQPNVNASTSHMCNVPYPTLSSQSGSTGTCVWTVQEALNYDQVGTGKLTGGKFDSSTVSAVKKLQALDLGPFGKPLPETGVVSGQTWEKLFNLSWTALQPGRDYAIACKNLSIDGVTSSASSINLDSKSHKYTVTVKNTGSVAWDKTTAWVIAGTVRSDGSVPVRSSYHMNGKSYLSSTAVAPGQTTTINLTASAQNNPGSGYITVPKGNYYVGVAVENSVHGFGDLGDFEDCGRFVAINQ